MIPASVAVIWSLVSGSTVSASTRIDRPSSPSSSWIVGPGEPELVERVAHLGDAGLVGGTSHTTPPSKSMPRLRPPRTKKPAMPIRISTLDTVNQVRRRPTKSMLVSPW